jgi:asparagine synthase (glutamine-hydrolysing)
MLGVGHTTCPGQKPEVTKGANNLAGIAGIAQMGEPNRIKRALQQINHRSAGDISVTELPAATMGQITATVFHDSTGTETETVALDGSIYNWQELAPGAECPREAILQAYQKKGSDFVKDIDGPFAIAISTPEGLFLARDLVGITPLYYGICEGALCFASEVKALVNCAEEITAFPPGHYAEPGRDPVPFASLELQTPLDKPSQEIASELHDILANAVRKRIADCNAGCWLSGGLDSSVMTALASRDIAKMKTFAVGVAGSPDLEHARLVADFVGTDHHELVCTVDDMAQVLPEVIYHLESFDAPLVRSSITNYMVGKLSSEHVDVVLSGEGGDELFAGYEYLRSVEPSELPGELVDITTSLHNTALQRVDRCSSAHGLVARVGFLDREVIDYALQIPTDYKIYNNGGVVEKWILRRAVDGLLPEAVIERPKAKFWEGAGVTDLLAERANEVISDSSLAEERLLPDGSELRSKEELLYYRIFRECFGDLQNISFVGRTKEFSG